MMLLLLLLKSAPEIYHTVQEELLLLGGSVLLGIPSGIVCDLFRFFRRLIPHHWSAVLLEDIVFLILVSFLLLCYVSGFARGQFRMYIVIGWLCGFMLHECTLGNLILHLWDSFVRNFLKLLKFFIKTDEK